jgi:DNA-binding winged helix-turn-helix (wHTH) protein
MNSSAALYRFGDFILEVKDRRLLQGKQEIYLRPKTFEVLLYLVEHQGHLVTKNEFLDVLWADVEVTENALTRCIKEVREALSDEVRNPKFIRTIPRWKRGMNISKKWKKRFRP